MKIQVTKTEIDNGCRRIPNCCPIALAIKKIVKHGVIYVHPSNSTNLPYIKIHNKKYHLPAKANKFAIDYDANTKVVPFEFQIDLKKDIIS